MTNPSPPSRFTIYIVSDGTGETAATMVRAALVQYSHKEMHMVRHKNIRLWHQLEPIVQNCFENRGLLVYTFAIPNMRDKVREKTAALGMPAIDLLGPMLSTLDVYFGVASASNVGALRVVDDLYFKRIEAIEYTVKHDDGKVLDDLDKADIILVGISRTSKTPLSIFLSHKGWKVANIPLVLGATLPKELFEIDQRRIIGLIIDMDSLQRIRRIRLEKFGQDPGGEYASLSHIAQEVDFAERLFKQNRKWPVFNVTERALEETASEIVKIIAVRLGLPESVIF